MSRVALALLATALLSAGATSYQPKAWSGGFSETQLVPDTAAYGENTAVSTGGVSPWSSPTASSWSAASRASPKESRRSTWHSSSRAFGTNTG